MAGKFVLKKNAKGQYHFALKAGNGETIAQAETYTSSARAPLTVPSKIDMSGGSAVYG